MGTTLHARCKDRYPHIWELLQLQQGFRAKRQDLSNLSPVATVNQILDARKAVQSVSMDESILDYLLAMVQKTRKHPELILGASPRSAVAWMNASKKR